MTMRGITVSGALLLGVMVQPLYAQCLDAEASKAQNYRHLQMQFMVGALACQTEGASAHVMLYNHFITEFGPALREQQDLLMSRFRLAYGKTHVAEYDRYLTIMANQISMDMAMNSRFCDDLLNWEPAVYDAESLQDLSIDPAKATLVLIEQHPLCKRGRGNTITTAE